MNGQGNISNAVMETIKILLFPVGRERLLLTVAGSLLLGAALLGTGCAPRQPQPGMETVAAGRGKPYIDLEERFGMRPEILQLSAAGNMLDFRYRVTDPDKAKDILSDRHVRTYIIDQKSGTRLAVPNPPKVGPLRQTTREPQQDKIYFSIFANPGKMVEPGDKVTVVIGDFRAEDLVVQ